MTITAMTSKTWMSPPMVTELTTPSNHKMIKMMATVYNIMCSPFSVMNKSSFLA